MVQSTSQVKAYSLAWCIGVVTLLCHSALLHFSDGVCKMQVRQRTSTKLAMQTTSHRSGRTAAAVHFTGRSPV